MFAKWALLVSCSLLVQLSTCSCSLDWQETSFPCNGLPADIKPIRYETHLKFASLDSEFYEGETTITLKFLQADNSKRSKSSLPENGECQMSGASENQIVMHADASIDIQSVRVCSDSQQGCLFGSGQPKERKVMELLRDPAKQMIAIRLKRGLNVNTEGTISMAFKGRVRDDHRAIHLLKANSGEYTDAKYILGHFGPAEARLAFPCFDEPQFRANVKLTISTAPKMMVHANAELASVRDRGVYISEFRTTPRMPIHMVSFVVGDLGVPLELESSFRRNGVEKVRRIRVIAAKARDRKAASDFALQVARDALEWIEQQYPQMGDYALEKLDFLAVPNLRRANSPSWGLGLVRESILMNDKEAEEENKMATAVSVAQVVASQWFGNLVSAGAWQDLWITQGLASELAFQFVQNYAPLSESGFLVRLDSLREAMWADQEAQLAPLSPGSGSLRSSEQLEALLDERRIIKSAALIQMVSDALGAAYFYNAQTNLIQRFAGQTISEFDFKQALRMSGTSAGSFEQAEGVINSFIHSQGVALLDVTIQNERVTFTPKSFAEAGGESASNQKGGKQFFVPAQARLDLDQAKIHIRGKTLIEHVKMRASRDFGSDPNIGAYYRMRYSDELFNRLKGAVERKMISPMERIQLLDDTAALTSAGLVEGDKLKLLFESYANEDHPGVVVALIEASKSLAKGDSSEVVERLAQSLLDKYQFEDGQEESILLQRARKDALKLMVEKGEAKVIAAAFEAYDKHNDVPVCLREPVYLAMVRAGGKRAEHVVARLVMTKSPHEALRTIKVLYQSEDPDVLRDARRMSEQRGIEMSA